MIRILSLVALTLLVGASAFAGGKRLAETTSAHIASAAAVDAIVNLKNVDGFIKIFSLSGGDPAMNGSYVNLAVYKSPQDGWAVYELGNVNNYRVLTSEKHGYAKLLIVRDVIDDNGTITQERSVMLLDLTKAEQGIVEVSEVQAK